MTTHTIHSAAVLTLLFLAASGTRTEASANPFPPDPHEQVLRYSVAIASYRSLDQARSVQVLRSRPGRPFYIAPVRVRGIVYYRLLAGMAVDRSQAARLMNRLVDEGLKPAANGWDLRPTRLAYRLETARTLERAESTVTDLQSTDIPAYVVPGGTDGRRFYVYAGGYANPEEAAELGSRIRAAGWNAPLVERVGLEPWRWDGAMFAARRIDRSVPQESVYRRPPTRSSIETGAEAELSPEPTADPLPQETGSSVAARAPSSAPIEARRRGHGRVELGIDAALLITDEAGLEDNATGLSVPVSQVRAGFFVTDHFAVEPAISLSFAESGGTSVFVVGGNVRLAFHLLTDPTWIRPYVQVGPAISYQLVRSDSSPDNSASQVGVLGGAGVKMPIFGRRLALRAEAQFTRLFENEAEGLPASLTVGPIVGVSFFP